MTGCRWWVLLIAFKARAWLDLTERLGRGEQIDSEKIKRRKSDVLRLYQIPDPIIDPRRRVAGAGDYFFRAFQNQMILSD